MRYYEIITEGFKEVEQKYLDQNWNFDPEEIKTAIRTFKSLRDRNQLHGNERDIDWWGKNKTVSEFLEFVKSRSQERSKTQIKRSKIVGKSITVREDDDWLIVVPLDKDASCFHGKNSDWCTAKSTHTYFEQYFFQKEIILIYCLQKKTGAMWAIACHCDTDEFEVFDKEDTRINLIEFNSQTGLDCGTLIVQVKRDPKIRQEVAVARKQYQTLKAEIETEVMDKLFCPPSTDLERKIIAFGDKKHATRYINNIAAYHKRDPFNHKILPEIINMGVQGLFLSLLGNSNSKVQSADRFIKSLHELNVTLTEDQQVFFVDRFGLAIEVMLENKIIPCEKAIISAIRHYTFGKSMMPILREKIAVSDRVILISLDYHQVDTYRALFPYQESLSPTILNSEEWKNAKSFAEGY